MTITAASVALGGAAVANPILECGVSPGSTGAMAGCLGGALEVATAAMNQALALARGTAGELDRVRGGELAVLGLEASQQAFEAYRDTECKTRAAFAAADPDPDRFRLACAIDLTRRRTDSLLGLVGPQAD